MPRKMLGSWARYPIPNRSVSVHGLFGDVVIVEMHFAFVGVQHANGHAEVWFGLPISPQKSNTTGLDGKIRHQPPGVRRF